MRLSLFSLSLSLSLSLCVFVHSIFIDVIKQVPRAMRLKSIEQPHHALNSFASLVAVIRGARHNTPRPFWSVVVLLCTFTLSFFSFMGVYDASIVAFEAEPYKWGESQIGW